MTAQHPDWLTIDLPGFTLGAWQVFGVVRNVLTRGAEWVPAYHSDPGKPPSLTSANWKGFTALYRLTREKRLLLEWFEYDHPDWSPRYVNETLEGSFFLVLVPDFFGVRLYVPFREGVLCEPSEWRYEAKRGEFQAGCYPEFPYFHRSPMPKPARASALDATPEELSALAYYHPDEVQANPALPLLSLEAPALYLKVQQESRLALLERELREGLIGLHDQGRRLFTIDCAERILPEYESYARSDLRPRRALEVARRFAKGEASLEELLEARRTLQKIKEAAEETEEEEDEQAMMAIDAALAAVDLSAYRGAQIVESMRFRGESTEDAIFDYEWQLELLARYLPKERLV